MVEAKQIELLGDWDANDINLLNSRGVDLEELSSAPDGITDKVLLFNLSKTLKISDNGKIKTIVPENPTPGKLYETVLSAGDSDSGDGKNFGDIASAALWYQPTGQLDPRIYVNEGIYFDGENNVKFPSYSHIKGISRDLVFVKNFRYMIENEITAPISSGTTVAPIPKTYNISGMIPPGDSYEANKHMRS